MGTNPNSSQNDPYGGYSGGYSGSDQQQPGDPSDPYAAAPPAQQAYDSQSGYDQQQQQQQQQQQYYQPPASAQQRGKGTSGATGTGLSANTAAALSYVLGWLSGLVFFVIERKNPFVRFSAAQSFILFGSVTIIYTVLRLITAIPFVGFLLSPIIGFIIFVLMAAAIVLWVFLAVQAYRGVQVKLPIVGDYAERLVNRFTRK